MSIYECPRIEDAAGYVLRALPEGEWESYGYHVAECSDCTAKVEELGFVSHALLSAVPQLSAPPDIRSRVMSVVRAESELLQAAGAQADRPTRQPSRRFGFAWLRLPVAGALAVALLVAGLGVGALLRGGDVGEECTTRTAQLDPSVGNDARGELRVCGGSATLALLGMKPPPDGRTYQMWLDDPNDGAPPKSAKQLFGTIEGEATVRVPGYDGTREVLITEETEKGSAFPTRDPVVTVPV